MLEDCESDREWQTAADPVAYSQWRAGAYPSYWHAENAKYAVFSTFEIDVYAITENIAPFPHWH